VFTAGIALGLLFAIVGVSVRVVGTMAPQLPVGDRCASCAVIARRTGRGIAVAGLMLSAVTLAALLIVEAVAAALGR